MFHKSLVNVNLVGKYRRVSDSMREAHVKNVRSFSARNVDNEKREVTLPFYIECLYVSVLHKHPGLRCTSIEPLYDVRAGLQVFSI